MSSHLPGRFDGTVAVVTGSAHGLGEATVRRLAREGASVVVTDRTVERGRTVTESIREEGRTAEFIRAEMANPGAVERLVERTVDEYGRIDVLVNNAAITANTTLTEATIDDWERVMNVDLRGYWLCVKHAIDHMPPGSCIVNISSNHAFSIMPSYFPYNVAKAGVDGMTRAMAVELGPLGIRANAINPGWVPVNDDVDTAAEDAQQKTAKLYPVGRVGRPEDIAGTVAFLASDDAAFITGHTVVADGGRAAVMQDDRFLEYLASDRSNRHTT